VLSGSLARAAGQTVAGSPYAINKGTLAANSNYTLVFAGANLTITKAPLTVTASNKAMLLNGTVSALTATLTGFQFSETLASSGVTGAAACTTSDGKTVGTFDIVCTVGSLQASNYSFGPFVKGTLTVNYAFAGTTCNGDAGHTILQPINADGTSVFKQGSTVPAKFRVCDVNGASIGTPGVVSSFRLVQTISGTITSVDEAVYSTTPDTAFRWDSTGQQWIFNISTTNLKSNATYVYVITLSDGSTIQFQFGLK
ncbi:MAG: PxKF domain-containing protein, partial [Solirubrobacteraceae bacterium]